jgi:hypothetical protein
MFIEFLIKELRLMGKEQFLTNGAVTTGYLYAKE